MEMKRNFLNHFQHPRCASAYDQNQIIISDVSQEIKHRIVLKLMNIVLE